jgi:hypothetical protein
MIGVAASIDDLWAAGEFFELFKTPWEPAVVGRKYAVVLSAGESIQGLQAQTFLVYHSSAISVDRETGTAVDVVNGPIAVGWQGTTIPIYGRAAIFAVAAGALQCGEGTLDHRVPRPEGLILRIGYDLFGEVKFLLTQGQPTSWAHIPTLDLHVELLRQFLFECGVSFLEIPPRPTGHDFTCCLTHDIDFCGIRRHIFDRTLLGFGLRASLGTLSDVLRRRRQLPEAFRNWRTLLSLPLVLLRLMPDFWRPFQDYASFERGRKATFFVVPFKNRPGVAPDGAISRRRAAPYQISEITDEVNDVALDGAELAVHGIDAWRDVEAGRAELSELTAVTGQNVVGIRMHWLYFSPETPARLEAAGFAYDSTWGYNDAVGYRAGTSQAFRPVGASTLLELPLTIMDSAMFYARRMFLTRSQASELCNAIVANARRFGGAVVVNWHDRSLAPERLWVEPYRDLLTELEKGGRTWFSTTTEAVTWFRWRRSIRFDQDASGATTVHGPAIPTGLPAARVAVQRSASAEHADCQEFCFDGSSALRLAL